MPDAASRHTLSSPAAAPKTPAAQQQSARRLAWGVLIYVLCVAAVAVLIPFELRYPDLLALSFAVLPVDVALNLALLFPAGFLFRLVWQTQRDPRCLHALALGVAVSLALETAQFAFATRFPSPVDVICNGCGAWLGAYVQQRMGQRLARTTPCALGLELPLLAVLYMLVPLLLLSSQAQVQPERWWVTLPLVPFSALIASSLFRHRLAQLSHLSAPRYSLIVGMGFGLGVLPRLFAAPLWGMLCAGGCAALTWLLIRTGGDCAGSERRFEAETLHRALPCFALYLAALSSFPWDHLPFVQGPDMSEKLTPRFIALTHVEGLTAITLLGYMLSELHARAPLTDRQAVLRAALYAAPVSVLFELGRSHNLALSARFLSASLLVLAAAAGAVIHRAQLHVARDLRRSLDRAPPARLDAR